MPLVSVVIPTYNGGALLQQTLESVFAQKWRDYEIVLIDDGSTDDTPARLRRLQQANGSRMRIIRQANGGIGAARNRGLEEALGDYVAFCDHDDLWMPEKLAEQVRFMQSHPRCAACGVVYALSPRPLQPHFQLSDVAEPDGIVQRPFWHQLHGRDVFLTSTLMIDRQKAAGICYATRRGAIEDVPFQIKLMTRGSYGIAGSSILAVYRLHPNNASKAASFYFQGIGGLRQMERKRQFQQLPPQQMADMRRWLAHIGRVAAIQQITLGQRLSAAALYLREFLWQLRDGRARFTAIFPIMLFLPRSIIRRFYLDRFKSPGPA